MLAERATAVNGGPPPLPLRLSKLERATVSTLISGDAGTLLADVEELARLLASPTDSGSTLTRRQLLARRLASQDALASQLELLLAVSIRKRDEKGATFVSRMLAATTSRIATLSSVLASDQVPRGRPIVVVGAVAIDARQEAR